MGSALACLHQETEAHNEGRHGLDDAEQARRQERGVAAGDANRLEDGGRAEREPGDQLVLTVRARPNNLLVIDGVDACPVLEDEKAGSDRHAAQEEASAEQVADGRPETRPDGRAVILDL